MGLRFRLRRRHTTQISTAEVDAKPVPISTPSSDSPTRRFPDAPSFSGLPRVDSNPGPPQSADARNPSPPRFPRPPTASERHVEPLYAGAMDSTNAVDGGRNTDSSAHSAQSSIISFSTTRSSLLDRASRIRSKLKIRRRKSEGLEQDIQQIPDELVEADARIAEYAMASGSVKVERDDVDSDSAHGEFTEIGVDVAAGERVNDGYVSFTVPYGWVACRSRDGFRLFSKLAVGFVKATTSLKAGFTLMETDRLQVVSEVRAVSSPYFVGDSELQVDYASFGGAGKGIAKLARNFTGACVFAMCGPKDDEAMIVRTAEELALSVRLITVPCTADVKIDLGPLYSHDDSQGNLQPDKTTDSNCTLM